jgi:GxxExxY protein
LQHITGGRANSGQFRCGLVLALSEGMLTDPYGTNDITKRIVGCAIRIHDFFGPGAFESVYHECMAYELQHEKLQFELERKVPLVYRDIRLTSVFYIDIVVEGCVAVELRVVNPSPTCTSANSSRSCVSQILPVGLLINFNAPRLVDGVKRIVNSRLRRDKRDAAGTLASDHS